METGFPVFRNRKYARRAEYMPLENDSDADSRRSLPYTHKTPFGPRDATVTLCDKCWARQVRSRATKRCLDCKQYLCKGCAKCDQVSRPWWIPKWILQCWKFIFTDAYTPHSVVDLQNYGANDNQHWSHIQEANRIQGIPRVTRNSLRSKGSRHSEDNYQRERHGRAKSACSDSERYRRGHDRRSPRNDTKQIRPLKHSLSFDGRPRRSLERRVQRSWGSDALVHNYRHDDIERLRRYKENWERAFDASSHEYVKQMPFHNKLVGKDVMIELTDTEAKVIVNEANDKSRRKKSDNANAKKKVKSKTKSDEPVTEQIFEAVPIWFKKPRKPSVPKTTGEYPDRKNESFKGAGFKSGPHRPANYIKTGQNQTFHDEYHNFGFFGNEKPQNDIRSSYSKAMRVDYIVEEPADPCPICLEDLPGYEARSLSCYHIFHTKCLWKLLDTAEVDFGIKCPVCSETTFIKNYYTSKENWLKELPISSSV